MKSITTTLAAACLGLCLLGTPSLASSRHRHHRHHRHHHHMRHHRMYHQTSQTSTDSYEVKGVRHTHPHGDLDKFSRSVNHEANNASKSVNHAFQGKKPTPKGYK